MAKGVLGFLCMIICYNLAFNQNTKKIILVLDSTDSVHDAVLFRNTKLEYKDFQSAYLTVARQIDSLQKDGFFEATISDAKEAEVSYVFQIHLGPRYEYARPDGTAIPEEVAAQNNIQRMMIKEKLTVKECNALIKMIATYYENQGYQYARVYLDETNIQHGLIHSTLKIEPGNQIRVDTISWDTSLHLPNRLVRKIIGVKEGDKYTKAIIDQSIKSLQSLPFLIVYARPQVALYRDKALITYFIKERQRSHLDALLGLLPGTPPDTKLKINGTFNADLINQFKAGESITFNFQSLQNSSQELRSEISIPYFLHLPFTPNARFNLYRRDSLFLEVRGEIGAKWSLGNRSNFNVLLGSFSSTLLKPDLDRILTTKTLPAALDTRQSYISSTIQIDRLDNGALSRRGYSIQSFITGYNRSIKQNAQIISLRDEADSSFEFGSLYKPFAKNGFAFEWGVVLNHFIPIGKYGTWFQSLRVNSKKASTTLQLNELYRMGGFSTLRGFDEESIFASKYILLKNEWRLMTGERGYLFAHTDLATMKEFATTRFKTSNFWSIGGGIVVDTSLGLLSVSTSVGRKFPAAFDFRTMKLHVGYINYF